MSFEWLAGKTTTWKILPFRCNTAWQLLSPWQAVGQHYRNTFCKQGRGIQFKADTKGDAGKWGRSYHTVLM